MKYSSLDLISVLNPSCDQPNKYQDIYLINWKSKIIFYLSYQQHQKKKKLYTRCSIIVIHYYDINENYHIIYLKDVCNHPNEGEKKEPCHSNGEETNMVCLLIVTRISRLFIKLTQSTKQIKLLNMSSKIWKKNISQGHW